MEVGDVYMKGDIKMVAVEQKPELAWKCTGCSLYIDDECCDSSIGCGFLIFKEVKEKAMENKSISPLDIQVGGSHYPKGKIQPIEFIEKNRFSFSAGNVVKYISRHKNKNELEDLKKVDHYIDLIKAFKYYTDKTKIKLEIEVFDYIASNKLNFFEGKIIEAISLHEVTKESRYLDVAKHCLKKLIKTEYGETDKLSEGRKDKV